MFHVRNLCVDVGLDGSLKGLGVGTNDFSNLVASLEEDEGGHRADTEFLGDIGDLVNVELVEASIGVCAGESIEIVRGSWRIQMYLTTHLTTWGAITLQGPHQVAKQSRTIRPEPLCRASSKAALLECR